MRHYKIVKSTTLSVIAAAILSVAANFVALFYTVESTIQTDSAIAGEPINQQCTNETPADTYIRYISPNIVVDFTSKPTQWPFEYAIEVKDGGNVIASKSGAFSEPVIGERVAIPINSTSGEEVDVEVGYADFRFVENPCYTSTTEKVFIGTVNEHGQIKLDIAPNSVRVTDEAGNPTGESVRINFEMTGHQGEYYHLFITSCDGRSWDKKEGTVASSSESVEYIWLPEETSCQTHDATITVKTFIVGRTEMTGMARTSVRVERPAAGGTPPGTGETPEDEPIGPIDISDEDVNIGGLNIKIPNLGPGSGSGIGTVLNILYALVLYLIGGLAIIGILVGGIQFITSSGNADQAAKAKKTIVYSVIGIIVAILAVVITNVVVNIF